MSGGPRYCFKSIRFEKELGDKGILKHYSSIRMNKGAKRAQKYKEH